MARPRFWAFAAEIDVTSGTGSCKAMNRASISVACAAIGLSFACQGCKAHVGRHETMSAEQCRATATQIGDLLVAAAHEPGPVVPVAADFRLVQRTDLPIRRGLRGAPLVSLTAHHIEVDGRDVADFAGLARELHQAFA